MWIRIKTLSQALRVKGLPTLDDIQEREDWFEQRGKQELQIPYRKSLNEYLSY